MEIALLNENLIDLSRLTTEEISLLKKSTNFTCVKCKKCVVLKMGKKKKPHFSHTNNNVVAGVGESKMHIDTKLTFLNRLYQLGIDAQVEKNFPIINRIADIYFEFKGSGYVFEIQKSPMSDSELESRIRDYRSLNIEIFWIFLGELIDKSPLYDLPIVMRGRNHNRLYHFCNKSKKLTIFENHIFVTSRRILNNAVSIDIKEITMDEFIQPLKPISNLYYKDWSAIKKNFLQRQWRHYQKNERQLVLEFLKYGVNLSLLPPVIGWPVVGYISDKPLIIWQSYIFIALLNSHSLNQPISIFKILDFCRIKFKWHPVCSHPIFYYFEWLVMFGVLIKNEEMIFTLINPPSFNNNYNINLEKLFSYQQIVENFFC